jgi:UDP-N-acetylmuramoyl-tripeptide--D-alanyl-D-alanine ligase
MDPGTLTTLARWRTPSGEVDARLPSPARFVADNATAALAVAWVLGVDPVDSAGALEAYAPVGPRFRAVRLACGATVYNDCFNANPVSLPAALRVLASLPGRRAAVIGDMLELGAREAELHAQVVAAAHTLSLDLLLLVGPRMAHAAQHAPRAVVLESPQEAAEYLRGWLRDGDRVLLKASRAMRMEHALEALQI